jgi:catechol 2,3-dioxygenase-like lactoylglutathione lyase family enzyme
MVNDQKGSGSMLGESELMAFCATADAERARAFYEGTLGLRLVADEPYALVFDAHGTMLRLQKVQAVTFAPGTALGWKVADIAEAVRELARRGVHFERYEGMEQDELGVWAVGGAKVAWFKDPDGHTLSLTEFDLGS